MTVTIDSVVRIQGHHLKHLQRFVNGKELFYNPKKGEGFRENESSIFEKILGQKVEVLLTDEMDDVCRRCMMKENSCYSFGTALYDQNVAKKLGLEIGRAYSSKEIIKVLQ